MKISIIAAVARKRAIGFENKLIYWLPNDLKRFKQLTTGHTIVMGRNTFDSLPNGPLPNRRNIVLTRKGTRSGELGVRSEELRVRSEELGVRSDGLGVRSEELGVRSGEIKANTTLEFFGSLEEALRHCGEDEEVYIIGGASVYRQALPLADRLCLTEIDDVPAQADTFFPDYSEWHETKREHHERDERHSHDYDFVEYEI